MEHEWLFRLIAKQLKLIILAFSEVIEGEKHHSPQSHTNIVPYVMVSFVLFLCGFWLYLI